jgi:hypothetical protein
MGYVSYIHGRIISGAALDANKKAIAELPPADIQTGPMILSEMFNTWQLEKGRYYFNPVISFGASYKGVEWDLKAWLLKFENLLRRLEFDTAAVKLETEIYGTHEFFWKSRKYAYFDHSYERYLEDGLTPTPHWFVGYGSRDMFGGLLDEEEQRRSRDICYNEFKLDLSFTLTPEMLDMLKALYKQVGLNNWTSLQDLQQPAFQAYDVLWELITYLKDRNLAVFKVRSQEIPGGGKRDIPGFILLPALLDEGWI